MARPSFLLFVLWVLLSTAGPGSRGSVSADGIHHDDYQPLWGWGPEGEETGKVVLEEMRRIQLEQLAGRSAGDDVKQFRAILCKTAGGIGNRIQGIMSCMMMALATRRALLLQWEREVEVSNGLMPCDAEDLFEFPLGINLSHKQVRIFKFAAAFP